MINIEPERNDFVVQSAEQIKYVEIVGGNSHRKRAHTLKK